jgi:predicted nucleic acid-binding protein
VKPAPDRLVVDWLSALPSDDLFLCAITIGEIRKGLAKLPNSVKKKRLTLWLNSLLVEYEDRILTLDLMVCENWGVLQGNAEKPEMKTILAPPTSPSSIRGNLKSA